MRGTIPLTQESQHLVTPQRINRLDNRQRRSIVSIDVNKADATFAAHHLAQFIYLFIRLAEGQHIDFKAQVGQTQSPKFPVAKMRGNKNSPGSGRQGIFQRLAAAASSDQRLQRLSPQPHHQHYIAPVMGIFPKGGTNQIFHIIPAGDNPQIGTHVTACLSKIKVKQSPPEKSEWREQPTRHQNGKQFDKEQIEAAVKGHFFLPVFFILCG